MELLDLDGVMEKGVFEIPSYQRGYAWQERQLKDFWNDLEHVSKLENQFHYMHSLTLRELEKMFDALIKKMLFSVVELNDNRIDPFSSFETINNRGKDLSTLELLKNRLHFVAHKICEGKKLEKLQQEINDTYTLIYHDLRQFEDDHLEGFLKHFVAYYYGEKGDFKKRLLEMEFNAHKRYTE